MTQQQPSVPGEFRCPDCGFVVIKSILNPATGSCGRDSRDKLEPCPNDGAILRPVLYADALAEARQEAVKGMAARRACAEVGDELVRYSNETGIIIWMTPPRQHEAVHESAYERLHAAIVPEEAPR